MAEQRKGAIVTMVILSAVLAGLGIWQFGGLGLGGGDEHEAENEHEYEESDKFSSDRAMPAGYINMLLERIAAEGNGRIIEVERETEGDRDLFEIKLVGPDNRVREIKVDVQSGKILERD